MKKVLYLIIFFLPLAFLFYCSLVDDNIKFEGKWWQSKNVSTNGSVTADYKDFSSNQMEFNSDRTFASVNPFTGEMLQGRWTIDSSRKIINLYNNMDTFQSNGSVYTNTAVLGTVVTNKYDFPDRGKMRLYDSLNPAYFIELTKS